jgi:hypothetical protein
MIKIALIAIVVIALGVFTGLALWEQHKRAEQEAYVRALIGGASQFVQPSPQQSQPPQPHTPWSPVQ